MKRAAAWLPAGIVVLLAGCDHPTEKYVLPDRVTEFSVLYKDNCSGCHGLDGRLGAARPLNDPLYLAVISKWQMRDVIAKGVPGTAMSAFAQNGGGTLTDQQITILAEQIEARWSRPQDYAGVTLPPYSADLGDASAGEAVFRTDADSDEDDIRFHFTAFVRRDKDAAALFPEGRDGAAELADDAFLREMILDHCGHLVIEVAHDLVEHLDNRDAAALPCEVLGHLHTNEACADDEDRFGSLSIQIGDDAVGIRDVPEAEYMLEIDAGDARLERLGPRGQDDPVVAFPVDFARPAVFHLYLFGGPVNPRDLREGADIDVVPLREGGRRGYQKGRTFSV